MGKPYEINNEDIAISGSAGHGGRNKARNSRDRSMSYAHYIFHHKPTDVKVSGRIKPGYYSRNELKDLQKQLSTFLLNKLTIEVIRKLKIPGHSNKNSNDTINNNLFEIVVGIFSPTQLIKELLE